MLLISLSSISGETFTANGTVEFNSFFSFSISFNNSFNFD